MAAQLKLLRDLLAERFPDAMPVIQRTTEPVRSGIPELDRILPGSGFPRGRLSVWGQDAEHVATGALSVMSAACQAVIKQGERAAWISPPTDQRTAGAVGVYWRQGPILVRPKTRKVALQCAEELLSCGGIAMVVLAGADIAGTETVRLSRAVREGGGAFVALTNSTATSSLQIRSRIHAGSYKWIESPMSDPAGVSFVTIDIRARALGWNKNTTLTIPVTRNELHLSLDPGLPDRRGAKRVR